MIDDRGEQFGLHFCHISDSRKTHALLIEKSKTYLKNEVRNKKMEYWIC